MKMVKVKRKPKDEVRENKVLINPPYNEQAHIQGHNIKSVKELGEALLALHKCAISGADDGKARVQGTQMDYVIEWNNRIHYYDIYIVHVDII